MVTKKNSQLYIYVKRTKMKNRMVRVAASAKRIFYYIKNEIAAMDW